MSEFFNWMILDKSKQKQPTFGMKEVELMNDISDFLKYFKATMNDESLEIQKHQDIFSCEAINSKIFVSLSNPNDSEEFTAYIKVNFIKLIQDL
jgi:hypothetical protein